MRYGVPYRGSKNKIAQWVVSNLPAGDTLIDLFAGGCAVTHAALLSGKWNRIVANDIGDAPQLFMELFTASMQTKSVGLAVKIFIG